MASPNGVLKMICQLQSCMSKWIWVTSSIRK
uniref:Uncharacterized protein n=1 Tax=Romanomermis culicivorax TaxID=13658 RepID=A0A915HL39_ROMCU